MTVRIFQVGGHVRDQLLGRESKDIDYAVEAGSFDEMREWVAARALKIFLEKPEFLTIRATFPSDAEFASDATAFDVRDFVLCRKDGAYSDGRRPDSVEVGNIFDDLARRDFSVNAIAISDAGKIIDPHGGVKDIERRLLRTVGPASVRFSEDALRVIRAMRFSITLGFQLDDEIRRVFLDGSFSKKLSAVSPDRIRGELRKCFIHDTGRTLDFLSWIHPSYRSATFNEAGVWLIPTQKNKR